MSQVLPSWNMGEMRANHRFASFLPISVTSLWKRLLIVFTAVTCHSDKNFCFMHLKSVLFARLRLIFLLSPTHSLGKRPQFFAQTQCFGTRHRFWVFLQSFLKSERSACRHLSVSPYIYLAIFSRLLAVFRPFVRKAEKWNCKFEPQKCNSVFWVWFVHFILANHFCGGSLFFDYSDALFEGWKSKRWAEAHRFDVSVVLFFRTISFS